MTFETRATEDSLLQTDSDRAVEQDSWHPVNLEVVAAQGLESIAPAILFRRDMEALLYPGKLNVVFGAPEAGKTWVALAAVEQVIRSASQMKSDSVAVVFIDFEDDARSFLVRLGAIGVSLLDAVRYSRYYAANTALRHVPHDLEGIDTASLIVVDTTNSAMTLDDLDPLSNKDALTFVNDVRRIRNLAPQAAILMLDHEPIATTTGRRQAIGAQSKLGAVDGAQYRAVAIQQPRPGSLGVISLHLTKDRPGGVRRNAADPDKHGNQHAANIYMTPRPSNLDRLDITVMEPQGSQDDELLGAILKVAKDEWLSKNQIGKLIRRHQVKRRDERIVAAIDELTSTGRLVIKPKAGYVVFSTASEEVSPRGSSELAEEAELKTTEMPATARDQGPPEEAGGGGKALLLPSSRPIRDEEGEKPKDVSNLDGSDLFGVFEGNHCRCGADVERYTPDGFPFCDECGAPPQERLLPEVAH